MIHPTVLSSLGRKKGRDKPDRGAVRNRGSPERTRRRPLRRFYISRQIILDRKSIKTPDETIWKKKKVS